MNRFIGLKLKTIFRDFNQKLVVSVSNMSIGYAVHNTIIKENCVKCLRSCSSCMFGFMEVIK